MVQGQGRNTAASQQARQVLGERGVSDPASCAELCEMTALANGRTGRRSLWSPGGKAPQDAAAGSGHASWGMSALVAPKLDASCCHGKKLIIAILCQQRAVTPMSGADRSSARAPLRHGESDSARTGDHRVLRSKADHRRDRPPSVSQFRYSRRGWHRYRVVPDEPRMPGPRRAQRDRASAALPSHRRPARHRDAGGRRRAGWPSTAERSDAQDARMAGFTSGSSCGSEQR